MSLVRDVLSRFRPTRRFFQPKPTPYTPIPIPQGKGVGTESPVAKKFREEEANKRAEMEAAALRTNARLGSHQPQGKTLAELRKEAQEEEDLVSRVVGEGRTGTMTEALKQIRGTQERAPAEKPAAVETGQAGTPPESAGGSGQTAVTPLAPEGRGASPLAQEQEPTLSARRVAELDRERLRASTATLERDVKTNLAAKTNLPQEPSSGEFGG